MAREITEHDLRHHSATILHALAQGESFLLTSNGRPVAELTPLKRRRFVPAEVLKAAFADLPPIDAQRFRDDLDAVLDQDPQPRV